MLVFGMDPFPRELPPHVLGVHHRLHLPNVRVMPARTATIRQLFGASDPSTTSAALDRIIREESVRSIKQWDFDSSAGKPVANPKRYLWEKVPCEERPAPPADPAPVAAKVEAVGGGVERPVRSSLPVDEAPHPGNESCVGDGLGRGERSDPPVVEAPLPGGNGGDRLQERVKPQGGAIRAGEEGERSREARRFEPYRQHRLTEFWRQRKSSGETKGRSEASSGREGEAERSADGQ